MRTLAMLACCATFACVSPAGAQPASADANRQVYEAACASCHGTDGSGRAAAAASYPVVPPDFADCRFALREPDGDWLAVSHGGGPVRGFSRLMPAFGEALTTDELNGALAHVRTFCTDSAWPRGELNLPRALVTGKAFPEDEAVLEVAARDGSVVNTFVYERRFGPRNQVELIVPLAFGDRGSGDWTGGVGDIALEFKRALSHSLQRGRIVSAGFEYVMPTGSTERQIGSGTAAFEPFLAFGQILPADAFVQLQVGGELPFDRDRTDELFWRAAFGRTLTEGLYGRSWSPMIEVLGARGLRTGADIEWDLVPQMQVSLNTRQHILFNAGVRVPVSAREGRPTQFLMYVLWDWFDGGLFEGW